MNEDQLAAKAAGESIAKILAERGAMYNTGATMDPETNFDCAYRLHWDYTKAVVDTGKRETPSHHHAMHMVLNKIARIATGKLNADSYDDAIGYLMLAKKIALREETK